MGRMVLEKHGRPADGEIILPWVISYLPHWNFISLLNSSLKSFIIIVSV